jgi:hypothetical protein
MTHLSLLRPCLALAFVSFGAGCDMPTSDDGNPPADGGSTGAPSDDDGSDATAGTDSGDSVDGSGDSGDESGDGSTGGPPDDGMLTCTAGRVVLGNPIGDPALPPADGGAAIDMSAGGPSLQARRLVPSPLDASKIAIATGPEIWMLDEAAGTVHHVLGDSDAGEFAAGPCASARVGSVSDMAFRSDGTLYLGDHSGNAVVEVTDPFGAACEMHYYAGNQTAISTSPLPHEPGFDDGPAAMATFQGPDFLAVDANDDLWVVDIGNSAVRKIDTAHQVTTVAELPSDYQSLGLAASGVVMADNGMLYLSVKGSVESSQNGTILEVDPASGTTREVATGRDDPWLVGSSGPTIAGIDQVGANLLATYVNGRIFTITMDDGEVTHVAGDGDKPWALADFAPGYDPFAEQAAMDLELDNHSASISGAGAFLTWADGRLLHTGIAVGYVVTEIDCQ